MPTGVVSGRVGERVCRRAGAAIIKSVGYTAGDVIKIVWTSIAATGELPAAEEENADLKRRQHAFEELMALRGLEPHAPLPHRREPLATVVRGGHLRL